MDLISNTLVEAMGIPENYAEHGGSVDHMIEVVHWFMLALFVGWSSFFLFTCWRFARRRQAKASYHGVRNHVTTHLEVGVAIFEGVLLLGFAFPLWAERTDRFDDIQAQDPVRARVIGYQFAWSYHYPGQDGKFGRIDRHLIEKPGDACIDPEDPNGWDDFVSPILKIPVGEPCILQVTSTDVIHGYAIVPMRIQQDAIPGTDIPMWFRPLKELETSVVCAQLCGEQHGDMVGIMQVVSKGAFTSWAEEQSGAAYDRNSKAAAARGEAEAEEAEGEEGKSEEVNSEEVNPEEVNREEVKSEEVKSEEVNSKEVEAKEVKSEEAEAEEVNPEEVESEEVESEEVDSEEVESEEADGEEVDGA